MRKDTRLSLLILSAFLLVGLLAALGQYRWDNKYTSALSGGWGYNVLQSDPEQPAWLVDGWEFYPGELLSPEDFAAGRQAEEHTYAGQYPNFSAQLGSPYGEATYRLVLENPGESVELSLYLPELLCAGRVYIGGELAGEQGSVEPYEPRVMDGVYSFTASGSTEIIIQCANYTHYYSGMYYPPAVGTPGAIARLTSARLAVYGLLCFFSLAAALLNLSLWALGRDRLTRRLGLLCTAYALRMSYPFLHTLGVPAIRSLYAVEDFCAAAVLLCAILLAGELSGAARLGFQRRAAVPAAAAMCAVCVIFPVFILPHAPLLINIYGLLLFAWEILAGVYLIFLSARALRERVPLGRYLLCSAGLYGFSLAVSALTAGYLEPEFGAWPEEYGTFALVVGFAALMVHRGVLLVRENRRLNEHLSEEVARKTRALETLLGERRELLATLVHDIKNPLSAVRSYADLVRSSSVELDAETAACLNALSERVGQVRPAAGFFPRRARRRKGKAGALGLPARLLREQPAGHRARRPALCAGAPAGGAVRLRRGDSAARGAGESLLQRALLHASGRAHHSLAAARGRQRGHMRGRHGQRHRARGPAPRLRARLHPPPRRQRRGPRPLHRPHLRPRTRRPRRSPVPARQRQHLQTAPAPGVRLGNEQRRFRRKSLYGHGNFQESGTVTCFSLCVGVECRPARRPHPRSDCSIHLLAIQSYKLNIKQKSRPIRGGFSYAGEQLRPLSRGSN